MTVRTPAIIALAILAALVPSRAQEFTDGAKDSKVHAASGFVCPLKIGLFERDAVGQSDPQGAVDFCAYSARDGVYGTITLKPLSGAYDAKTSFADDFAVQEGTGGRKVAEGTLKVAGTSSLEIFTRSYEISKLEDLHYRVLLAGAALGNWAVETTMEYAEPRDNQDQRDFLDAVYRAASAEIAARPAASAPAEPPLAPGPGPR